MPEVQTLEAEICVGLLKPFCVQPLALCEVILVVEVNRWDEIIVIQPQLLEVTRFAWLWQRCR